MKGKTDMRKHRLTVEEWRMIRQLRKEADVVLKKPEPLKGKIHVVIPEHYGAKGVIWVSRFINENQLDAFVAENPNLQILDPDVRRRYQPEPEEDEDDEEPEVIEEDGDAQAVYNDDDLAEQLRNILEKKRSEE